jgi:hypothetical protein
MTLKQRLVLDCTNEMISTISITLELEKIRSFLYRKNGSMKEKGYYYI